MIRVAEILRDDPERWHVLGIVAELGLPDCWIGAGFVRNAVWDALHGRAPQPIGGDVDLIWYDPQDIDPGVDRRWELLLHERQPTIAWSVKNQARMHQRNGDLPYVSAVDAMRFWPETATAIAARRGRDGGCEIAAPFGLDDLFNMLLRPTPQFTGERFGIFARRVESKGWLARWPLLRLYDGSS